MNLWQMKEKERGRISKINGEISPNHMQRLQHLGIDVGVEAECTRVTPFSGPKSFQISGGIFSLDREIALHVEISPETIRS